MHPARRGIQTGLNEDQRGLATRYLPMAESLAKAFEDRQKLERDELRSTAYMALVEAARTFDPYRKVNFATFARHRIRGALRDYMRFLLSENWRGSRTVRPSFERLGQNAEEHGRVLGIRGEKPIGTEIESIEALEQWLHRLPPMHALTCRLIYLGRKSQEEVSQLLGWSRGHVSRLHTEALTLLLDGFVPCHKRKANSAHKETE
jgi:RNA polymerase sigma factor (sigma-70 family)